MFGSSRTPEDDVKVLLLFRVSDDGPVKLPTVVLDGWLPEVASTMETAGTLL